MSTAAIDLPSIVATVDGDGTQRITVFATDTSVICGAFKPPGHMHWRLYVSTAVAGASEYQPTLPPHHLLTPRRQDACQWLELITDLYTKSSPHRQNRTTANLTATANTSELGDSAGRVAEFRRQDAGCRRTVGAQPTE